VAKNQRQRRPLQDEGRTNKKTARERAQASRRQRDRIEENRDRREQRRERDRLRRQTVDSIRSPKEDVRIDRLDSRLVPVEDTFLGQPVGVPRDLPVLIGERWDLGTDQTVTAATWKPLEFGSAVFTTERNGYPAIYTASTFKWRVPAGLAGIWSMSVTLRYTTGAGGTPEIRFLLNGATAIATMRHPEADNAGSMTLSTVYNFMEADEFTMETRHFFGSNATVEADDTWAFAHFLGK